jgi:hypothetical protein
VSENVIDILELYLRSLVFDGAVYKFDALRNVFGHLSCFMCFKNIVIGYECMLQINAPSLAISLTHMPGCL